MADSNFAITKVQDQRTGVFENTAQAKQIKNSGLMPSFHSAWTLVQHESTHTIRVFLASLKYARGVCSHLTEEIDNLIVVVEARLAEIDNLDRDVREWERALRKVGYR